MEKYKVAAGLPRFVDHGHIVVYRIAHFVGGCGFDELPNGTAHGGTVVNNKESGPVCAGHGGDKLLPFVAKNNTDFRICSAEFPPRLHSTLNYDAATREMNFFRSNRSPCRWTPIRTLSIGSVAATLNTASATTLVYPRRKHS